MTRSTLREHLLPIILLLFSATFVYRDYLTGSLIFSGKDFLTAFAPLLNFQSDCLQAGSLPLWNPFMNFGYPFVEHYSSTMFFPTHLFMGLVTGSSTVDIQREIVFWIFIGGVGIYFFCKEEGGSNTAALLAGISFMFCGQMLALPHWHVLVYNAACFPWMMLGWKRAVKKGRTLSLFTVAFTSFSIFGGYLVSTVLGLYLYACYVIAESLFNRKILLAARHIALSFFCAALIAAPKLLPLWQAMKSATRLNAEIAKDPVNIVNSYSFLTWLMPVKFYFSIYIGVACLLGLSYALVRRSVKINSLLIMFVLSAWLLAVDATGDFSLLRYLSFHLPFMKLVRNEWLQWFFPSIFAILYLAKPLDRFVNDPDTVRPRIAALLLFLAVLAAVYTLACNHGLHLKTFLTQAALAVAITGACLTIRHPRILMALLFIIVLSDFGLTSIRVRVDTPHISSGNGFDITVTHQIGASRSLRDNQLVSQSFPLHLLDDRQRPPLAASALTPTLSSGLDGDFTDSMNYKRFAGWWYNTQERHDFERLKESPQLGEMEGMPLYALLAGPNFQPAGTVNFDAISCRSFEFSSNAPEPALFLLHQFSDPRWQATVDGRQQPIEQVNGYFMGIGLGEGSHKIKFSFSDRYFSAGLAVSALTLCGLACFAVMARNRDIKNRG